MLTSLKMRVRASDLFLPEVAEEKLLRPSLFCGRMRAVVDVKGRGSYDCYKDESPGEGSVLDRPHLARPLQAGAF